MGLLDYGQGANAFLQNMLQVQGANRQHMLEKEKLELERKRAEQQQKLYAAQIEETMAQAAERRKKLSKEDAWQMALANRTNPVAFDEQGQTSSAPTAPMGLDEELSLYSKHFPKEGLAQKVELEKSRDKGAMNPLVKQLIDAAEKGTITDKGKEVLKVLGYGEMFTAKPERLPLVTDESGVRVEDKPGVKAKGEPADRNQQGFFVNEKNQPMVFDPKTGMYRAAEVEGATSVNPRPANPFYQVVPGFQTPAGQPAVVNSRTGQVGGAGGAPSPLQPTPSAADVKEARSQTSIDAVLDEVETVFKAADKALPKDAKDRILGMPGRIAGAFLQTVPELVLAASVSKGFTAKFARAAGEVGTMTEGDIKRGQELTPSIHDTPEVRKGKLKQAKELYLEIYKRGRRQENPLGSAVQTNKPKASDFWR